MAKDGGKDTIFTTNREIASCQKLSQMQMVLQQLKDQRKVGDEDKVPTFNFFMVRVFPVLKNSEDASS
jgi:hypothetical protein